MWNGFGSSGGSVAALRWRYRLEARGNWVLKPPACLWCRQSIDGNPVGAAADSPHRPVPPCAMAGRAWRACAASKPDICNRPTAPTVYTGHTARIELPSTRAFKLTEWMSIDEDGQTCVECACGSATQGMKTLNGGEQKIGSIRTPIELYRTRRRRCCAWPPVPDTPFLPAALSRR